MMMSTMKHQEMFILSMIFITVITLILCVYHIQIKKLDVKRYDSAAKAKIVEQQQPKPKKTPW